MRLLITLLFTCCGLHSAIAQQAWSPDNGDGTWTDSEGGSWKTANSASQNDTSDNASAEAATASYTLKDDSGNTVTVSPDSDGSYFDSNGVAYQNEGSGKWIDENGTTWSES